MHQEVLLAWLAGLFGLMAATLVVAAVAVNWAVLLVAIPLGAVAALLWYHASGRLTARMRRQARRRHARGEQRGPRAQRQPGPGPTGTGPGPFDAPFGRGPRGREPSGFGSRSGPGPRGAGGAGRGGGRAARRGGRYSPRGEPASPDAAMSRPAALSVLGLEPDADDEAVRAAYRRKVKEAHPDRGGDRETFIEVTEAYEALGGTS